MKNVRWMVSWYESNADHDILQNIQVYAPHENKETVKRENKKFKLTRKRELLLLK